MKTVPNTKNNGEKKNSGGGNGNSPSGIPRGNTVAVVGDPGTGKTTFLLTHVTHGSLNIIGGDDSWQEVVCLGTGQEEEAESLDAIDNLFSPALSRTGKRPNEDPKKDAGTLRCFISLENNLSRILDNHGQLLNQWLNESNEAPKINDHDQFIMIDATAFLSGRLEDRIRYPRLAGARQEQQGSDFWRENSYDLNLGGHHLSDDEHFGLYFQTDEKDPKRIEQLGTNKEPFSIKKGGSRINCRSFNMITRPIADPFQRVRLLKDLLAEVFIRFPKCTHRLLAIDSLSALMNSFGENEAAVSATPARRLNMLNLVRWLEEYGVTTFMACEAEPGTNKTSGGHQLFLGTEEQYLASGVIQLNYHPYPSGDIVRYLRVLKMRGAAHDMRPHAYDLSREGVSWVEPLFGEAGMVR